jgi:ATP-dependent DNA helicase PIF1
MTFSREQQYAFDRFLAGDNLFITGPGGTGKTYLIREMVRSMRERDIKYQICAMTGCAAVLLGSGTKTLHSWTGMGLANGHKDAVIQKIVYNKKTVGGIKKTRVLIVDEVSMMSKKIFDCVNAALKLIKKSQAVFGGIQVIFTGDFFQLPPVGGNDADEDTSRFCFESANWCEVFPPKNCIELKWIFRQEDDVYKKILEQVRRGELDADSEAVLRKCVNREVSGDVIPTKLFATRAKTDFVNGRMYEKLEGEEVMYKTAVKYDLKLFIDSGKNIELAAIQASSTLGQKEKDMEVEMLMNQSNRVNTLGLKRGARVMCLHNICVEEGICNGSQGIILDFVGGNPLVKFSNGRQMIIEPVWVQSDEYPCIGVGQIPLCLAWALTIHKIQGATLTLAEMDLGLSVFEYGQTYVALSRIKSLEGLYLSAFQPKRIKANPLVKEFYKTIPDIIENINETTGPTGPTVDSPKGNIFQDFAYVSECSGAAAAIAPENQMERDPTVKVVKL